MLPKDLFIFNFQRFVRDKFPQSDAEQWIEQPGSPTIITVKAMEEVT